jgi:hypothetical protein
MSISTSYQDLQNIFNHNIRAKDLAEFLVSFDYDQSAKSVKEVVKGKGYTVVGVRKDGDVNGYIKMDKLNDNGIIGDYIEEINDKNEINENEGIMETLNKLKENDYYFVKILNHYGGIITRSDIKKITFRLWVYGTISIFEILLLDILRSQNHNENTITEFLNESRINAGKKIYELRKIKDEFIDFLECLQLSDKLTICLLKNKSILANLNLTQREARTLKEDIEYLRNEISHGNDYSKLDFDQFYKIIKFIHNFIEKYENDELDYNLN